MTGPWAKAEPLVQLFMERCSCYWCCCPRQTGKGRKTLAARFFPPQSSISASHGPYSAENPLKWEAEKGAYRGQLPANTEQSSKEQRAYLRANVLEKQTLRHTSIPGLLLASSLTVYPTSAILMPAHVLCLTEPPFHSYCYVP